MVVLFGNLRKWQYNQHKKNMTEIEKISKKLNALKKRVFKVFKKMEAGTNTGFDHWSNGNGAACGKEINSLIKFCKPKNK